MQTLQERLARLLQAGLQQSQTDLETLPNGHVCGHVISSEFEDLDYQDRRQRIRSVLDKAVEEGALRREELSSVSTLLTYTPAEWSAVTSDI